MKRTSTTTNEKTKRDSLLKIDNDNIENLKMLTGELDTEDLALIRQKYNEKKELSKVANFVKDYVNELKEGIKDNYYNDDNFESFNAHIMNPKSKNNYKSDMFVKHYINKMSLNDFKYENNNNAFTKRSKHSKKSKKSKHSEIISSDDNYFDKRKTISNHNTKFLKLNNQVDDNNYNYIKRNSIVIKPNKTYRHSFFLEDNNFENKKTSKDNLYGRKKSISFLLDNLLFEKKKVIIVFLKEKVVLFLIMIL